MKRVKIPGLEALLNGRGPFSGNISVQCERAVSPMDFRVIVGFRSTNRRRGDHPHTVCVVRTSPNIGFFRHIRCPHEAEIVAKMLCAMRKVNEEQLENLSFVEGRRELVGN